MLTRTRAVHDPGGATVRQADRSRRRAFVAAGLLPSLWLVRRMPLGFFAMVGFWAVASSALVTLVAVLVLWRGHPGARRVATTGGKLLLASAALWLMTVPAILDVHGHIPVWTDPVARSCALLMQVGVAVLAVLAAKRAGEGPTVAGTATAYGSAIVVAIAGVAVGRRMPMWVIVPIVGVVAARFALLPIPAPGENTRRPWRSSVAMVSFFTSAVAATALQSGVLARPGGLVATGVAFAVGLVIVGASATASEEAWAVVPAGAGLFAVLMFFFAVLMPSLAGSEFLLRVGFRAPPVLAKVDSRYVDGRYEQWYATDLDRVGAIAAMSRGFRSPPVSVRPAGDSGVTGLLYGYRMEVRFIAKGEHPRGNRRCSTELHACVLIAVKRPVNY